MELLIIAPAPGGTAHAAVFRDLLENQYQFRHFQHYLTGPIVLPNKSMANIARCHLDSADKTNLSRFLSEAPWREEAVNLRRVRFILQQTKPHHIAAASRWWFWTIPCANTWGAFLITWTGTTTTATGPFPWPIIRSPASMSAARCASPWACGSIAAMRN